MTITLVLVILLPGSLERAWLRSASFPSPSASSPGVCKAQAGCAVALQPHSQGSNRAAAPGSCSAVPARPGTTSLFAPAALSRPEKGRNRWKGKKKKEKKTSRFRRGLSEGAGNIHILIEAWNVCVCTSPFPQHAPDAQMSQAWLLQRPSGEPSTPLHNFPQGERNMTMEGVKAPTPSLVLAQENAGLPPAERPFPHSPLSRAPLPPWAVRP